MKKDRMMKAGIIVVIAMFSGILINSIFGYSNIGGGFHEDKGLYKDENNRLLTGKYKVHDDYGDISELGEFRNGKLVGKHEKKRWIEEKKSYVKYLEENYDSENKRNGIYKMYYKDESTFIETTYNHGEKNGAYKKYYFNGQIQYDENYKDGKLDGWKRVYYLSGALKVEAEYIEGKVKGIYKWYYEEGSPKIIEPHDETGEIHGEKLEYYKNGQLHKKTEYVHGKREGEMKSFYDDGSKKYIGIYKDDNVVEGRGWYQTGEKLIEVNKEEVIKYKKTGNGRCILNKKEKLVKYYEGSRVTEIKGRQLFESEIGSRKYYTYDKDLNYTNKVYRVFRIPEKMKNFKFSDLTEEDLLEIWNFDEIGSLISIESKKIKSIKKTYYNAKDNVEKREILKGPMEIAEMEEYAQKKLYEDEEDIYYVDQVAEFEYDENDKLIREKSMVVREGWYNWDLSYIYDKKGRLITEKYNRSKEYIQHFYEGDKWIKREFHYQSGNFATYTREYDDLGRIVKKIRERKFLNRIDTWKYKFYKDTNMYTTEIYEDGETNKSYTLLEAEYDDKGRNVKFKYREDMKDPIETYEYKY